MKSQILPALRKWHYIIFCALAILAQNRLFLDFTRTLGSLNDVLHPPKRRIADYVYLLATLFTTETIEVHMAR